MEQRRHNEVEAKLQELVRTCEPDTLTDALYDFSRKLLNSGYPREALLAGFKHLVLDLRQRADEAREDDVMEVLDVLTFSPAGARPRRGSESYLAKWTTLWHIVVTNEAVQARA